MKRLALTLAALTMSASAHAAVYEVVCTKSEVTPRTAETTYRVFFDDVNNVAVIVTDNKIIPYVVDRVAHNGHYVDAVGRTHIPGVTWAGRFADPHFETDQTKQWFATFNGRKQVTDQCEDSTI